MTFTEVLDQYNIDYQKEGRYCRPGWIQMACCFCHGGTDPNKLYLGYNLSGNYFHCWRCGFHGVISTLKELGVAFKEAREIASSLETEDQREYRVHAGKLVLPAGIEDLGPAHIEYLEKRGFNPKKIAKLWGVLGIGMAPRLSWRLWIPIHYRGKIVSWTTRGLTDKEPRYVSASPEEEAIPHKDLLYGSDLAGNTIIVHEGPLDVWATGPGAVCTFGVQVTDSQIAKIAEYPRRIIVFDNEAAAQRRARRLVDSLSVFSGVTIRACLASGNDAAVADVVELDELRSMMQ
jgi:DNA primase